MVRVDADERPRRAVIKSVVALLLVVGGALVTVGGCAASSVNPAYKAKVDSVVAAQGHRTRQVPASASLEAPHWKLGQWALYKRKRVRTVPYNRAGVGYEKLSVVAEDSCGTWIEVLQQSYEHRWKWMICMRSTPSVPADSRAALELLQMVISQQDDDAPTVVDFRGGQHPDYKRELEPMLSSLIGHPSPASAAPPRDEVDVPAGHFSGALRERGGDPSFTITSWYHQDVPFEGTVKRETSDGLEVVLLDYGHDGASSIIPELATTAVSAPAAPSSSPAESNDPLRGGFLAVGVGFAGAFGLSNDSHETGPQLLLQAGAAISCNLQLVAQLFTSEGSPHSTAPTVRTDYGTLALGLRWTPLRSRAAKNHGLVGLGRYFDPAALYAQLGVGLGIRDRTSYDAKADVVSTFGPSAQLAIGWLPSHGRDYAFGFEVRGELTRYGDLTRRAFDTTIVFQFKR